MCTPHISLLHLEDGSPVQLGEDGKVGRASLLGSNSMAKRISRDQLLFSRQGAEWTVTCTGLHASLLQRYGQEPIKLLKDSIHRVYDGDVIHLLADERIGPLVIHVEPVILSAQQPDGQAGKVCDEKAKDATILRALTCLDVPPQEDYLAACKCARSWLEERCLRDGSFFCCSVQCQRSEATDHNIIRELAQGVLTLQCARIQANTADTPHGADLTVRWCNGVDTFGNEEPERMHWAQLPNSPADLSVELRGSRFYSKVLELFLSRSGDEKVIGPVKMTRLDLQRVAGDKSPGAVMLQSLLEHHADLETSMANQQERCKRLQSRVGDIEAKLSTEIEQLRREEAREWSDYLPLLNAKRRRLESLEKQAITYDLAIDGDAGEDNERVRILDTSELHATEVNT